MIVRAVGISWYREADYLRARSFMFDSYVLPPTYREWLRKAENQEKEWINKGLTVVRIMVEPDEFAAWCEKNGLRADAKARVVFATDGAADAVKRTH